MDDFSSIIGDATEGREGIDSNHRDMVKFRSRDDDGYRKVSSVIRRWTTELSNRPRSDVETQGQASAGRYLTTPCQQLQLI